MSFDPACSFELPLSCFREESLLRTLVTGDGDEDVCCRRLSRSGACRSGTGAKLDVAVREGCCGCAVVRWLCRLQLFTCRVRCSSRRCRLESTE